MLAMMFGWGTHAATVIRNDTQRSTRTTDDFGISGGQLLLVNDDVILLEIFEHSEGSNTLWIQYQFIGPRIRQSLCALPITIYLPKKADFICGTLYIQYSYSHTCDTMILFINNCNIPLT